jgi:hypothetical protein
MNVSVSFAKTFYKLDVSYSLPAFSTTWLTSSKFQSGASVYVSIK